MRKGSNTRFKLIIHSSFYLVALGFVLTGNYLNFIVFVSLVVVHEFGHCVMATLVHVKVKSVTIYPFGGITKLDTFLSLDIEKELLVAMGGVLLQYCFYLLIGYLYYIHCIREYTFSLYTMYNSSIIFFNLLPIYPLDGGKIVYLLLCLFLPYRIADIVIIIFSYILIFVILLLQVYYVNYSNIMIYFILIYYIFLFFQKRNIRYYKFLMERYLYSFSFQRSIFIHNFRHMYKNRKHYFIKNKKIYDEREYISSLLKYK